jgi:hypothetical protein
MVPLGAKGGGPKAQAQCGAANTERVRSKATAIEPCAAATPWKGSVPEETKLVSLGAAGSVLVQTTARSRKSTARSRVSLKGAASPRKRHGQMLTSAWAWPTRCSRFTRSSSMSSRLRSRAERDVEVVR